MKIIYSGLQFNNYKNSEGLSFEHNSFYLGLKSYPNAEVIYFPFDRILEIGKERFNQEILEAVKREKPDIFFAFMLSDEFEPDILKEIKKYTVSLAWFADDSWRFYNYSRFWAPYFTWAVPTYSWMPELYKKIGQPNIIRSQWAANTDIYRPISNFQYPISNTEQPNVVFIGLWKKPRERIISAIKRAGINIQAFGAGWPNGRISREEMIKLFSISKINLGLNPAPGYFNKNSLGRLLFKRSINKIIPDFHIWSNFQTWLHRGIPQINARHFEIPACKGFMLTSFADDLDKYYEPGKEIIVYDGVSDLIDKVRYYLSREDERLEIAAAGYERTIQNHTYEARFKELFDKIGL